MNFRYNFPLWITFLPGILLISVILSAFSAPFVNPPINFGDWIAISIIYIIGIFGLIITPKFIKKFSFRYIELNELGIVRCIGFEKRLFGWKELKLHSVFKIRNTEKFYRGEIILLIDESEDIVISASMMNKIPYHKRCVLNSLIRNRIPEIFSEGKRIDQ